MKQGKGDRDIIICRCRDVTEEELKQAIEDGFDTMELLKRKTKIGTGTCGGRTCLQLVRRILARETGRELNEIKLPRERSPIVPLPLRFAAGEKTREDL
ncbi:(2Fe-2S)-binding protein [Candidatus Bipolaricaulota bacterium]|nr:(2Fe-2S)-binding protein [Candidatus Bipolaricaulota bacterium]